MNRAVTAACVICIFTAGAIVAETIAVGSNVFSFPVISAVKNIKVHQKPSYFRQSGLQPLSRSVTFSWSLPGVPSQQAGAITLYSLQGRVVSRLPVYKSSGTATWHLLPSQCGSGVYIARIRIGTQAKNLKLMLWN